MASDYQRLTKESDYWRMRAFLQEVMQKNDCLEHSWHPARLDYAAHFILPALRELKLKDVTLLWEQGDRLAGFAIVEEGLGDIHLAVDPEYDDEAMERDMLLAAEQHLALVDALGVTTVKVWCPQANLLRAQLLAEKGYKQEGLAEHQWRRDLSLPLAEATLPEGFRLAEVDDALAVARVYAAGLAFHPESTQAAEENAAHPEWFAPLRRVPAYRPDLDLVAVASDDSVAAFVTLWYDEPTRTAYFEPVGTVPEHQRKGLAGTLMTEAMRRAAALGCRYAFVGGYGADTNVFYEKIMGDRFDLYEPWVKKMDPRVEAAEPEEAMVPEAGLVIA